MWRNGGKPISALADTLNGGFGHRQESNRLSHLIGAGTSPLSYRHETFPRSVAVTSINTLHAAGGAAWSLVGLITRRSQVQTPPPQPIKSKGYKRSRCNPLCFLAPVYPRCNPPQLLSSRANRPLLLVRDGVRERQSGLIVRAKYTPPTLDRNDRHSRRRLRRYVLRHMTR